MIKDIPEDLYPLFSIVGEAKALEVLKRYQGRTVYFSKAILKQLEREEMKKDYDSGASMKELVAKYKYTAGYIKYICKS